MAKNQGSQWDGVFETEEKWMKRAIELAEMGRGKVHPNPMVGAVLVKDQQIIGEGYHGYYGGPHGEIEALRDCERRGNEALGADLYVTLEPCCHYGKTPPCTEALINAGVKRVFIAIKDPNPLVGGKGIDILRKAGILVSVGILRDMALAQNKVFFHYIKTQRPYVILKSAASLDGKIATRLGESQWITSETARQHGHRVRGSVRAIMTGIGTVLADNPMLTCRLNEQGDQEKQGSQVRQEDQGTSSKRQPLRIVIDSQLKIPLSSKLVQSAEIVPLWVVCGLGLRPEKQEVLKTKGVTLIEQPLDGDGYIHLRNLMAVLGQHKIDSLLIEGGGSLNDSALRWGIVDEVHFYVAPILIGGAQAKSGVAGLGVGSLAEAVRLENMEIIPLGKDILIKGKVLKEALDVYRDC